MSRRTAFDVEVVEAGDGPGPPIVYLHGFSRPTTDDAVLQALAEDRRVLAPVAPGYNDLAELDHVRDVHELALHYDDVLADLGLDGAIVVGHSFGAMVGAELAAHVPDRVGTLVACAPLGLWDDEAPVADVFAQPSPVHRDAILWSDPAKAGTPPELVDLDGLLATTQGLTAIGAYLWPLPDKGLARRLRRIRARTLVVWGDRDEFVPVSYADRFSAGLGGAPIDLMLGCGHMAPYERPEEFARIVRSFVG